MELTRLAEKIYTRRSHRKYSDGVSDAALLEIRRAISEVRPLYPEIEYKIEILEKKNVRSLMPWLPRYSIALISRTAPGYLENAGFILAQLDLFIHTVGLGACYIGLARPTGIEIPDGYEHVMLLAFGESRENHKEGTPATRRKALSEIADTPDPRLEPARLAPSSVNSQPWYFTVSGDTVRAYQRRLVRTKGLTKMNRIDVGIALGMLYVANPDTFSAEREVPPPILEGCDYVATVKI